MARRWRGNLPLLMAGLLLQTGCVMTSPFSNVEPPSSGPDPLAKSGSTLPVDKSIELQLRLADKYQKTGNLGEAAAQLEMVHREDPNYPGIDRRLANLKDEIGQLQTSIKEHEKRLAENPKDPVRHNDLGWVYYDLGSWSQAEKCFRQAVALNPTYQLAWNNLGLTLGQQERYQESMEAFLKVVSPAEAECNMAFIFRTQGKRDEARQAYVRALDQNPTLQVALIGLKQLDGPGDAPPDQRTSAKPAMHEPQPHPTDVFPSPFPTSATSRPGS